MTTRPPTWATPSLPALAAIPTTWDDTPVLNAKVGEFVVIAHRSGKDWYIGALTDRQPRVFEVPLDFLPRGGFQANVTAESVNSGVTMRKQLVTDRDTLRLTLSPAGGGMAQIIATTP